jgi:hypothetical protein
VKKYGETSLGCNKKRGIHRLQKIDGSSNALPVFTFYNFNWVKKGHHVRNYFIESHMQALRMLIATN